MVRPGFAAVSGVLALLKAAVRDAAANTVRLPETGAAFVAGVAAASVVSEDCVDESESDPHAENRTAIVATASTMARKRMWMRCACMSEPPLSPMVAGPR